MMTQQGTAAYFTRQKRLLLAVLLVMLALPPTLLAGYFVYVKVVPAYSASFYVEDLQTTVTRRYYLTADEMSDDGRRVTFVTPSAAVSAPMCGYDWAHWARTSVYRTSDGIAVLGRRGCDLQLVLDPLASIEQASDRGSETWRYLGAFDVVDDPRSRQLRFIPAAEQAECLELATKEVLHPEPTPRNHMRQARCPAPPPG